MLSNLPKDTQVVYVRAIYLYPGVSALTHSLAHGTQGELNEMMCM